MNFCLSFFFTSVLFIVKIKECRETASLLLKCCFSLLHPIYLGNIVATKKKNIMEICGTKVMKKNTDKKIPKCYNEVQ
ncbi:MAG TPA: hypothetical protein DER12_11645 [Lachnospiraceae bacterium]|nr:hypothetical protein [Lachnospiraceae bacterium]